MRSPCSSGRHARVVNRKRKRSEAVAVSALLDMNTSVETGDVCEDELHDDSVHEP